MKEITRINHVGLRVRDLATSRAFYEKLGFEVFAGQAEQNWLILRNGHATVGLFEGMFERNILTFNPGWDANAEAIDEFTDVRELQAELEDRGVDIETRTEGESTGPASFVVIDPDGNPILVDQHV